MKTARLRSLMLYILLAGALAGVLFFVGCFFFQGGTWAMRQSNQHLDGTSQLSNAGDITDRNGNVVAYSSDGQRFYSDDYSTRCALLHVLGDTNGYIATGVQSTSLTKLTGFNPILGLGWNKGGSDMKLAVDATLEATAFAFFGGRKGAAVLYNYKTGELLCSISMPTFDPTNPPENVDGNSELDGVFLDKVLLGTFTPGSTFKVVTAAAAIENMKDYEDWTFNCEGSMVVNGNEIVCDSGSVHGKQTIKDALMNSCNCAFAQLALDVGASDLQKTAEKMGFNQSFKIDDNQTAKSNFDVNGKAKEELAWAGIGQFTDTANPLHMAIIMSAIANKGTPTLPFTIAEASGYKGSKSNGSQMMSESTAAVLDEMMRNNVVTGYGDSMFPNMNVCAKTGTAESDDKSKADTGWIVGYSQNSDTPYAFAVVVEEGGYGYSSAGQIAAAMMLQVCNQSH